MPDYQVIARKFRPKSFKDVVGQDAIVTTLKNAIRFNRLGHAYLFCGPRGTGKTTLARLLAKAINCHQLHSDLEPCNTCPSCKEIGLGASLDVIEIDGASHRGIEDIRQINDSIGYAVPSGRHQIYIIDEVHMLTKEAFNALLKTLEEPPAKVKFLFATTEPHKLPSTILSRCQRFNLSRISRDLIIKKLKIIAQQLNIQIEEEVLLLLSQRAEGGLRDAESLLDQLLTFGEGAITLTSATTLLGLMPRDIYFEIDHAGKKGEFIKAFEIAHRVFSEGKEISSFLEGLLDHLRLLLLIKVSGYDSPYLGLNKSEKEKYQIAADLYSQEQCLDLIEYLLEAQNQLRTTTFGKVFLETVLLHLMRSHFRLPIEHLVQRMGELEQMIEGTSPQDQPPKEMLKTPFPPSPKQIFDASRAANEKPAEKASPKQIEMPNSNPTKTSISEEAKQRPLHEYDTLLHFAAVELDGRLQKH